MSSTEARRRGLLALLVLGAGALLAVAEGAQADARTDYLVRLLTGSSQFRVRAQAAISLGNVEADRGIVDALAGALRDEHPAVRAAAASSLGRLGDASALAALRRAASDREAPVRVAVKAALAKLERSARERPGTAKAPRAGPPRFYVAVAPPSTRVEGLPKPVLSSAFDLMRQRLQEIDGVVLAPDDEAPGQAEKVLRGKRLRGFYVESSVTSVEQKPDGAVRVAVSVILATYPGRDMRAILQGAATALGGSDPRQQAMAGAIKSALRQLPQALERE